MFTKRITFMLIISVLNVCGSDVQENGLSFAALTENTAKTHNEEIPAGICQVYYGTVCEKYLKNQSVFVPPNLSLNEIEERLKAAYGVIKESKDMNPNCRVYALPSLCFSSLPLCRTPERTNLLYFSNRAAQKERKSKKNNATHETSASTENHLTGYRRPRFLDKKDRRSFLKRKSTIAYDDVFSAEISSQYPPTRESENLRRICRDECELLENELCQKEYAIAKRHPVLGQKLPLEECQSLPRSNDCSSLGITIDVNPEQDCYWENGAGYRGTLAWSSTGKTCLRWSWLMKEISDFPELAGQNYCRNPGNVEERPWCFVDDKSFEKIIELCDIPKCADKMWFYIFVTIGTVIGCVIFYMVYVCVKKRREGGMTNIQNINTPNADKNIYGNSQVNSSLEMTRLNSNTTNEQQPSMFSQNLERSSLLRVPQYTLQDMEFVEELGEGAFGKVYKGQLTQMNGEKIFVAVKALKENASLKTQQDFRREIELISDLKHDNIVCILGVVLNKEPYCMLFEYMSNGDLHEFLIANSPSENKSLTQLEFLKISLQISEGMEYLSSHHYVHRDLAARNCLVGDKLTVKISDFGLSRDIYSSDYYRVQSKSLLPVRWMPSESILYGKFTTESDVWSFGVVLWEIYSYGMQPYYGHSNQEVINLVRSRQLLSCPEACPTAVYSLMIECWHEQSVRRPSFSEIAHRLKVWYQGQVKLNSTPTLTIKASPNT
ncbi:tyrosine-protein kinase transmembrane receptor Ror [Bactrocera neohumeralis]|uniref:tyrosine-protein kinase transmembrane receptor Ror n=1 Tax=Bactrocera tryoni TaxID=59916 RepID=UPI001A97BDEE|nr:tyrosine-protein kinase transmembrane receptor Ror [Bactrocera tryoni]XP_050321908.1 tyrosine-protein kinase transmembrane receptor Ror [Bactrocera neohumeralis]